VITGTYEMELSTSDGLLNLSAQQGESTPVTIIVQNTGSGQLERMRFRASSPTGWEVVFEPSEIPVIPPGTYVQVVARIKPASDAIPGDYSVRLIANTSSGYILSKTLDLRVTVLGSAAWGLVGLFIIIIVVLGMVFIFWRLGRR
jgi:uncharacterized membrane protein